MELMRPVGDTNLDVEYPEVDVVGAIENFMFLLEDFWMEWGFFFQAWTSFLAVFVMSVEM
jgi:hypothetical protein